MISLPAALSATLARAGPVLSSCSIPFSQEFGGLARMLCCPRTHPLLCLPPVFWSLGIVPAAAAALWCSPPRCSRTRFRLYPRLAYGGFQQLSNLQQEGLLLGNALRKKQLLVKKQATAAVRIGGEALPLLLKENGLLCDLQRLPPIVLLYLTRNLSRNSSHITMRRRRPQIQR